MAYLLPPALKSKARYMNLEPLVTWAGETLQYLDAPTPVAGQELDEAKLRDKLDWLAEYRHALGDWDGMMR